MALLSIITINLNNKNGLNDTLSSIKEQTFKDYQLIVVDGKSNDGSNLVIDEYQDIIDYAIVEKDTGIYNAMNKGIKKSSGVYLYFLNSGDLLSNKDCLTKIFSQEVNSSFICANFHTEVQGDIIYNKPYKDRDWSFSVYDIYTSYLCHQAFLIKREMFDIYGLYNENLKIISDWELFFIAIGVNKESVSYKNVDLVIYNAEGISSTIGGAYIHQEKLKAIKHKITPYLYSRLEHLYFLEQNQYIIDTTKKSYLLQILVRMYARIFRMFKNNSK